MVVEIVIFFCKRNFGVREIWARDRKLTLNNDNTVNNINFV